MKACKICGVSKDFSEYSIHRQMKDGYRLECKKCYNFAAKSDPTKFIHKMYATQVASSKRRGHPAPNYTREDFLNWALSQQNWKSVWEIYQQKQHDRNFAPSVDRVDSNLPYTFDNIELVCWGENSSRGIRDIKSGYKYTQHKPVVAYTLEGKKVAEYVSLHEAARKTGTYVTNIQRVADGIPFRKSNGKMTMMHQTGGYRWKWK